MNIVIDPKRFLSTLSICLDFNSKGLHRHHQRVAYLSSSLANEMGLSGDEMDLVYKASIIHDVGVSTWREKQALASFEIEKPWEHCRKGFEMVSGVNFLKPAAHIIMCHHDHFGGVNGSGLAGGDIPLAARIIHLADRVDVSIKGDLHVLNQSEKITSTIADLSGSVFDPELVKVFKKIAEREIFWLELTSPFAGQQNMREIPLLGIGESEMMQAAGMFATIIDRKNPFTYRHSRSVAGVAVSLAAAAGFGAEELFMMELAGLMHDLGKLTIPDEILEKPDSLTPGEFAVIRQHTYYTYQTLREAGVPHPVPEWAAYHHERLDGKGYPFHLNASQLTTGSRIMAVADVFTALREDRPYRPAMDKPGIERIMSSMVSKSALDGQFVELLFDIYDEVDMLFKKL